MSGLHKKIYMSLGKKLELCLLFFVLFGFFKNGLYPYFQGFYSLGESLKILIFPLYGYILGYLIDYFKKSNNMFSNRFYGLLFSLILPISTKVYIGLLFISILILFNALVLEKKDSSFNFIALFKILLVLVLKLFNSYNYANLLESSNRYIYSFVDTLIGFNESGIFTSCSILIIICFIVLCFDRYYKKEIPLYSYSIYAIMLFLYALKEQNMLIFLNHLLASDVLFCLVFIAPLSSLSPYLKGRKVLYSIVIGILTLPLSIYFNYHEGVYMALVISSSIELVLNVIENKLLKYKQTNV